MVSKVLVAAVLVLLALLIGILSSFAEYGPASPDLNCWLPHRLPR
jgi:hypothetical protein